MLTTKPSGQWLTRVLLMLALILMSLHFIMYVVYAGALIRFPFDYDQGEGFELVDTVLMSEGEWPYQDNDTYPFYASNYPPVYHVVLIPFAWIFGAEYWYGRLISFVGTLVTAGAIGYAVKRSTRHRTVAVLSGLAFLASNYIYHVGPLFRQHYFMVMFETLALVILANAFSLPSPQQRRRVILAMGLLLLAGYTKQLAYATVIAAMVWLFIQNPRRAIVYGTGLAGCAGLIFLWLNISTNGEWWTNVIAANVNDYYPWQFQGLAEQFFRLHWPLLTMAGLMVFYEIYFARLSVYSVWFVLAGANSTLSGKWGAGDSYFASFIVAMCILAGIFIGRTLNQQWTFPENYITRLLAPLKKIMQSQANPLYMGASWISLALVIVYGFSVIKMPTEGAVFGDLSDALGLEPAPGHRYPFYDSANWTEGYATIGHLPSQQDHDNGWKIVDRIKSSEKPVMSEEAGFSLQADRTVITNPTQLKNLYENDLFDPTNLVNTIENQEFGLIIFRAQFYPPPILSAVYDAYEPTEIIEMNGFAYELWTPNPTWTAWQPIRDYLRIAKATSEPLTVSLNSTDVERVDNWLNKRMNYRAWVPLLMQLPEEEGCPQYGFIQAGEQVIIKACQIEDRYELTVNPPQPFNP